MRREFISKMVPLKRGLKAKSMGAFKVKRIVLDWIGVDFILSDQAVPEIFHFKHDVDASIVIIFIGNFDVNSLKATSFQS